MEFYLTIQKVVSVLTTDKAALLENPTNKQTMQVQVWMEDDYLCKNYILNWLSDDLYDYYNSAKSTREIWKALQKKYETKEAGAKKYVVSRYLKYQMTDDNSVEAQSHEIQKSENEIIFECMTLDEQF